MTHFALKIISGCGRGINWRRPGRRKGGKSMDTAILQFSGRGVATRGWTQVGRGAGYIGGRIAKVCKLNVSS